MNVNKVNKIKINQRTNRQKEVQVKMIKENVNLTVKREPKAQDKREKTSRIMM